MTTPIDHLVFQDIAHPQSHLIPPPPTSNTPPPPPPPSISTQGLPPPPPPAVITSTGPSIIHTDEDGEHLSGEKRNPTFQFGSREIDQDSFMIFLILLSSWVFIWYSSGLFTILDTSYVFVFGLFSLYLLSSLLTSDSISGGVVFELNNLLSVEQMVAILFGTMVLFTIFFDRLQITGECSQIIKSINLYNLIMIAFISMWVNVWTSGRSFRFIRKMKQGFYNIVLCLFLVIMMVLLNCSNEKR